jgi:ABC-type oligopeptide transport system substrate-binding subunit
MKSNRTISPAKQLLSMMLVVAVALVLGGCKDDKPSVKDVNTKILSSHGWTLQSLTVDGTDKTNLYTGMTLSFTALAYATTHGAPVWPASGMWSLSADGKTVERDDHVIINVDEIADRKLVLSLTWSSTTYGGGRMASVSGNHVYTFVK